MHRRTLLAAAAVLPVAASTRAFGQTPERTYSPQPGAWRTFDVTTRVEIANAGSRTQAWVPVPGVDTAWQTPVDNRWSGNARDIALRSDPTGAQMVYARWDDAEKTPLLEVVSRFRSQNRATDWSTRSAPGAPADLATWLKPTELIPTDGIVKITADKITSGRQSDLDKLRAIYAWVVSNTYRDPKTRGCGVGDIKGMLESGNMGGKCADINALFVGLARASGVPARDLYGIRVARSAFGYRELGAGGPDISKAQHCRAEAWLAGYGWVAMDPADVCKVMRQEAPEWIKDPKDPLVAPVNRALFGSWEGNWLAYNMAHDVALPDSRLARIGFLMYPQAETRGERIDSLDPDTFKYSITVREVTA